MSQSAVSQQMQLLEHHLGQKLFIRIGRSIQLSDSGRAFLPLVRNMMRQINIGAMQIFTPQNEAVVEVNVNTAFGALWLAPQLASFNAIYPQISIRQLGNNWATDFAISTAELEIRYGSGDWPGVKSFRLVSRYLRPYCTPNNARLIRVPKDIKNLPLLDVLGTPQGWDTWLKKTNLDNQEVLPRQLMDSYITSVAIAANGLGICLVYDDLVQQGIFSKQLVSPFVETISSDNTYYLCYKRGKVLSHASLLFKDWLLAAVRSKSNDVLGK